MQLKMITPLKVKVGVGVRRKVVKVKTRSMKEMFPNKAEYEFKIDFITKPNNIRNRKR